MVDVSFVVNETKRKIVIAGNQGFDNYFGTKIYAMIDDGHLTELQKGNKKGERVFKGSISETKIDNQVHTLKIKSEILGGTLEYSNMRFSYKTPVRHITLNEFDKQQENLEKENGIMKRLSIIIPVYNVNKYINVLLNSIFEPGIDTAMFEVIIIDDGSSDGTGELCDMWAEKHSNIIVMHQPNSGSPAGPRNKGILRATGEYIFFADADDYFYPTAVKKIIEYINSHDTDVVLFKVDASDWGDDYFGGLFSDSKENCNIYNSKILNSLGPWKLFKRKLIIDNGIKFPEGIVYEELPFTLEAYFYAIKIAIIADISYYKYVKREGSISTAGLHAEYYNSRIKGIKNYLKTCSRLNSHKNCPQIYIRGIRYTDRMLPRLCSSFKRNEIRELKDICESVYCDEIRSLLPFSKLINMDALMTGNYDLLKAIVESWPDGPKTEFFVDINNGKQYYKCIPDAHSESCLICSLPEDHGWGREKMEDPHITRNLITEANLTASRVSFKGHMNFVRKLEGVTDLNKNDITATIRLSSKSIDKISKTKAEITNLKTIKCYASVWQYEFDWSINLSIEEFMDGATNEKQQLAFFLDVLVDDNVIENRFGHRREKNVVSKYFENAVLYKNWVLAPTITEFSNISLNIVPVDFIKSQVVDVKITINEDECKIDISGNQGFDNFIGTKVMAVVDDEKFYEMKKGKRRGERTFKGTIPVLQDNISHTLKIKSVILGGELDYLNMSFP